MSAPSSRPSAGTRSRSTATTPARSSRRWSAAAPCAGRRRSSVRPRRAAASPSWKGASASTASRRRRSRPPTRWRSWKRSSASRRRRSGAPPGTEAKVPEAKSEPTATRAAYGAALVELGEAHEDVVALDADLAVSTQSIKFGKRFPERFFNCGAAEAGMMSMACGLAATGKVPYASTFAIFATGRAYDQVRLGIAHNELPVKIGASHGGVSIGEDGASHQMIEDIALSGVMPRLQVIVPADYNQAYRATVESYDSDAPTYLRFGRPATPVV